MLITHTNMSKNDIANSSLPFIFAIYKRLTKRLCEKLGISYNNTDTEPQEEQEGANSSDNQITDEMYPESLKRKLEGKNRATNATEQKTFNASSKSDIINFFGSMATIEDNTK